MCPASKNLWKTLIWSNYEFRIVLFKLQMTWKNQFLLIIYQLICTERRDMNSQTKLIPSRRGIVNSALGFAEKYFIHISWSHILNIRRFFFRRTFTLRRYFSINNFSILLNFTRKFISEYSYQSLKIRIVN